MATSVRVRDNSGDLQSQPPNLVVTTTPDVQLESESVSSRATHLS